MYFSTTKHTAFTKKRSLLLPKVRYLLLLLCFCTIAMLAHAQQQKSKIPLQINPLKDKLEYGGYTIRLIPTIDGYYGFDILKEDKLMLHQIENPVPAKALTNKEDAFITAKWLIGQYKKSGYFPRTFPPGFERQLHASQPAN